MNKKNWENKDHPRERWLAKLMEEVGEVSRDILEEIRDDASPKQRRVARLHLITELEHVEFIAKQWRKQLQKELNIK